MKLEDLIENSTYVLKSGRLIVLTKVTLGLCRFNNFNAGGGGECVPYEIDYQFSRETLPELFL